LQSRKPLGIILFLITALIWGCAFVAQSVAAEVVGPFTFQSLRSFLGFLVLLPVIAAMDAVRKRRADDAAPTGNAGPAGVSGPADRGKDLRNRRTLILAGILCGIFLTIASVFQQYALTIGAPAGKAGFITAFYLLLVPVFGLIFLHKKTRPVIWLCVAIALAGLYFLCAAGLGSSGAGIAVSDIFLILCAVCFAVQILIIDHFVQLVDGVKMACIEFLTSGILAGIFMLIVERPAPADIIAAGKPLLYAGLLSSGVAYTLQIVGQKFIEPTVASMLMSLESVFAVLSAIVILGQMPTAREWIGCALMFAAILLSQLPERKRAAAGNA